MADRALIYDFGAALEKIISAHSDLVEVITKWEEMLDTVPRMVEFDLTDGTHTVPNVQMIIDNMERSALPRNPQFNTVTATGASGSGTLSEGGLKFSGADRAAEYDVNGVAGYVRNFDTNVDRIPDWPPPRYMSVSRTGTTSIGIRPNVPPSMTDSMGDCFVRLGPGQILSITFKSYNKEQVLTLNCPGSSPVVWHLAIFVTNRPQGGGISCNGYATLMNSQV